jgi:hypothetical protein
LSQSDPTDHALAAIASIFDHPEPPREPEQPEIEEKPIAPGLIEADGYSKAGPGPIESIRFRWTVRRDDRDDYYVDETIGDNSRPIVNGPFTDDAAIRFVDDRASDSQRRFELIKSEMTGQASLVGRDGGEM